jgi:MraZ protein
MARGFDQCVFLFHRDEWDNILEQVTRYASMNRKALEFRRLFFSSVSQVQLDGQGRMPVAANLRAIAGIQRDVALIGVGDHLELWDRETWRAYQEKKVAEYQEMASELFSGIDEAAPGAEDGKGLSDAD